MFIFHRQLYYQITKLTKPKQSNNTYRLYLYIYEMKIIINMSFPVYYHGLGNNINYYYDYFVWLDYNIYSLN